jgi:hypothetical protein
MLNLLSLRKIGALFEGSQGVLGKRLPRESTIDTPSKRQRTDIAKANTASRIQSAAASEPPTSIPSLQHGRSAPDNGSITIDAFDASRRVIAEILPTSVTEVHKQQILQWNKKKAKWHRRHEFERIQCMNSFAEKKSTIWFQDGHGSPDTEHACTDCESRGRVCATMCGINALKICPLGTKD